MPSQAPSMGRIFRDREDAGRELARRLLAYRKESPIVLGLPRGGVPVADEVARALDAPLDVWVAHKVGAPVQPELGMGAVAEGGEVFLDARVREVRAPRSQVRALVAAKTKEVEERSRRFRHGRPAPDLCGKTVIVVDDGIATGGTARGAPRAASAGTEACRPRRARCCRGHAASAELGGERGPLFGSAG